MQTYSAILVYHLLIEEELYYETLGFRILYVCLHEYDRGEELYSFRHLFNVNQLSFLEWYDALKVVLVSLYKLFTNCVTFFKIVFHYKVFNICWTSWYLALLISSIFSLVRAIYFHSLTQKLGFTSSFENWICLDPLLISISVHTSIIKKVKKIA